MNRQFENAALFGIGGLSGMIATIVVQPIDTLKVQFQVVSEQLGRTSSKALSLPSIVQRIKSQYGIASLYRGMDSAIFRQLFYASARIGAYQASLLKFKSINGRQPSNFEKIGISVVSGAFGAMIGNPFDVALIRRQASLSNNSTPYRNTFEAFRSIIREEGVISLWRGFNITLWRVVIINLGQLAGKDIISEQLTQFKMKRILHDNLTALLASLFTAVISLPVDNIKVKLQKQGRGEVSYGGISDCLLKTIKREGMFRLWVGLPIYLIRGTPHSFIIIRCQQFLTQEYHRFYKPQQ